MLRDTDDMIAQGMMAEDQDRIRKAFRIDRDGLISVPFSDLDACSHVERWDGTGSGIQLIWWTTETLAMGDVLPLPGNPRRVVRRDSPTTHEIIGISDSHVRAFSLDSHDALQSMTEVRIGTCVTRTITPTSSGGGEWRGDDTVRDWSGSGCF